MLLRKVLSPVVLCSVFLAPLLASAQQTNALAKYDQNGNITNSQVWEIGGNVGIGVNTPGSCCSFPPMLQIAGGVYLSVPGSDNVAQGSFLRLGVPISIQASQNNSIDFWTYDGTNWGQRVRIANGGYVGIGTTTPAQKLEVAGSAQIDGVLYFGDGTVQSTAWNGMSCGADYAESVDISGARDVYEPGDLLTIDANNSKKFTKSSAPYATTVAGIYSTKPGVLGTKHPLDLNKLKKEVPMAMVGLVPTKVSAENGPIMPGDLLVSSSTIGYAMKGTDRSRMLGAVIGKALEPLQSGTGIIEVLVTLQ